MEEGGSSRKEEVLVSMKVLWSGSGSSNGNRRGKELGGRHPTPISIW